MAIMVASFRDSLDAWLERILPADLYFRAASGGDTAYLTPDVQAMIAALPGVRRAEFLREQQLLLDPARPRIVLQARSVDPADPARALPLVGAPIAVAADCAAAGLGERGGGRPLRLRAGDASSRCRSPASVERFTVAGVWRDYGRQQGVIAMERPRYIALTGDRTVTNGALWLADGADRPRGRGVDPARRSPAASGSRSRCPARSATRRCTSSTARSR